MRVTKVCATSGISVPLVPSTSGTIARTQVDLDLLAGEVVSFASSYRGQQAALEVELPNLHSGSHNGSVLLIFLVDGKWLDLSEGESLVFALKRKEGDTSAFGKMPLPSDTQGEEFRGDVAREISRLLSWGPRTLRLRHDLRAKLNQLMEATATYN